MKRQNASISATRSTEMRTASASVLTPSAFRARLSVRTSTKSEVRFKFARLAIVAPSVKQAYILSLTGICQGRRPPARASGMPLAERNLHFQRGALPWPDHRYEDTASLGSRSPAVDVSSIGIATSRARAGTVADHRQGLDWPVDSGPLTRPRARRNVRGSGIIQPAETWTLAQDCSRSSGAWR